MKSKTETLAAIRSLFICLDAMTNAGLEDERRLCRGEISALAWVAGDDCPAEAKAHAESFRQMIDDMKPFAEGS